MITILEGDWIARLRELPEGHAQMCVTSPPYWNLRNYQNTAQMGMEATVEAYVARLVEGFEEVRRILKEDGTMWLNLGDTYAGGGNGGGGSFAKHGTHGADKNDAARVGSRGVTEFSKSKRIPRGTGRWGGGNAPAPGGCKPKDLIGVPWQVAFALRDAGWYLRSEITWCKKVPMPESVTDRPTAATEKIFLFSKSRRYFYNAEAVRNPPSESWANDPRWQRGSTDHNEKNGYELAGAQNPKRLRKMFDKQRGHSRRHCGFNERWDQMEKKAQIANGSNMRNWWLLGPEPFSGNHFATFPTEVPRRAILAGSRPGDVVLDPFAGSGTTGKVAIELGRKATLIELNPDYVSIIRQRCQTTMGLPL